MKAVNLENYKVVCIKEKEDYVLSAKIPKIATANFSYEDAEIEDSLGDDGWKTRFKVANFSIEIDCIEAEFLVDIFNFKTTRIE